MLLLQLLKCLTALKLAQKSKPYNYQIMRSIHAITQRIKKVRLAIVEFKILKTLKRTVAQQRRYILVLNFLSAKRVA